MLLRYFLTKKIFQTVSEGFTIIEVIISVGILSLIGALALVSFINSRNIRELTTSGQNVLSILRIAQSKTLGGEDNLPWGVRLERSQTILFRGPTFAGATFIQTHALPANLEIVNISLNGGGDDVIFKKVSGVTDQWGSFQVRVRSEPTMIFPVTVAPSGKVYPAGTAPVEGGARLIDTRHRVFNLGWSIKGYSTTTLTFSDSPNPDILHIFAMASYFNADQTKFDWSGTLTIGGKRQTLRIHTISLTDTNTVLSIDRDCRKNTKGVRVTFNTRDVATYSADCQNITVGAYGGTMSEP